MHPAKVDRFDYGAVFLLVVFAPADGAFLSADDDEVAAVEGFGNVFAEFEFRSNEMAGGVLFLGRGPGPVFADVLEDPKFGDRCSGLGRSPTARHSFSPTFPAGSTEPGQLRQHRLVTVRHLDNHGHLTSTKPSPQHPANPPEPGHRRSRHTARKHEISLVLFP